VKIKFYQEEITIKARLGKNIRSDKMFKDKKKKNVSEG